MNIRPMIGEHELTGVVDLKVIDERRIVQHRLPGLNGHLLQDLGGASTEIRIIGSLSGDEKRGAFLEEIRGLYDAGDPVVFVTDLLTATDVEEVIVADLQVREHAGEPEVVHYAIRLTEYVPPPATPVSVEQTIEAEAAESLDGSAEGLKAETALLDLGVGDDVMQPLSDSLVDTLDAEAFNTFVEDLSPEAADLFGDFLESIPLEQLQDFAETLGLTLPPGAYDSVGEVLEDLLDGVSFGGDGLDVGTFLGGLGKIGVKLIATLAVGSTDDTWTRLLGDVQNGLGAS